MNILDFDGDTLPDDLWRDDTQPGNTRDARDEQCTAQSRPGRQPKFFGIDDYACEGAQLHFAICQYLLSGIGK